MNINLTIDNKIVATRVLKYLNRQAGIIIETNNSECPISDKPGDRFRPSIEKRLKNIKEGKNITKFKSVDALF